MSIEEERDDIWTQLESQARALWMDLGRRLLLGQDRYGGFKFGEVDLDQMALEEIEDFIVYRAAQRYMKAGKHER